MEFVSVASEQALSGPIHLATVLEVLRALAPSLRKFRDAYPNVVLEVDTDLALRSLARREADVAIRPGGRGKEPDVIARRLCGLGAAAYAAPQYVEQYGHPRQPAHLCSHQLVTFTQERAHFGLYRWLLRHGREENVAFRGSSMNGMAEAIAAGLGVGVLPCWAT